MNTTAAFTSDPLVEVPFSSARRGKIARLSPAVREELNRRLELGEIGASLLAWLNDLPETQEILQTKFDGVPISQQNLSFWHQGGYREWLRHQEDLAEVHALRCEAAEVKDAQKDFALADHISNQMGLHFVQMLRHVANLPDGPEKWQHLCLANREINQLRRVNLEADRVQLAAERWQVAYAAVERQLADESADRIERKELRGDSAILSFNDRFDEIEKELAVREAAGEPVADDRRQLAIDRADLEVMANKWYARLRGLPGHHSYRPAPPPTCFQDRFARYVGKPKPASVSAEASAQEGMSPETSEQEDVFAEVLAQEDAPPEVLAQEVLPAEILGQVGETEETKLRPSKQSTPPPPLGCDSSAAPVEFSAAPSIALAKEGQEVVPAEALAQVGVPPESPAVLAMALALEWKEPDFGWPDGPGPY